MALPFRRRDFLRTTTLGLAALGARRVVRAAPAADRFGGFLMGLQTYTFRNFSADAALARAKELGLATVEMFDAHFPLASTAEAIGQMRSRAEGLGLKILAHGVNPFTNDHAANRRVFEFAKAAGIRNLSADPREDAFDSLEKLVAEFDIRIAIHNHGPGARYDKVADVLRAVDGLHPHIGACADLGHYIRSAEDPVRAIRLLEGRLFGIHLKDFSAQTADAKGVILGQGHLDLANVFRELRKVDFPRDACLALEYEEHAENPLEDVRQCLEAAAAAAQQAATG